MHTEASDYAIGRVLVQEGHPVAYESRKLNETERRGPREGDESKSAWRESYPSGASTYDKDVPGCSLPEVSYLLL